MTSVHKCPQVSTSVHNFKCCYCHNLYANNRSLSKHMHSCSKRQQEINTLKIINQEKDRCIEIAKQTKIVNNIQNNKTINLSFYKKYLTHHDIKDFNSLTPELAYEWKVGEALIWDRSQLHCSDNFENTNASSKTAIAVFTNYKQ